MAKRIEIAFGEDTPVDRILHLRDTLVSWNSFNQIMADVIVDDIPEPKAEDDCSCDCGTVGLISVEFVDEAQITVIFNESISEEDLEQLSTDFMALVTGRNKAALLIAKPASSESKDPSPDNSDYDQEELARYQGRGEENVSGVEDAEQVG